MQIKSHKIADKEMEEEHGVLVEMGQPIIEAFHLEQHGENSLYLKFERGKKAHLLFKESIVYPYVDFESGKKINQILIKKKTIMQTYSTT